MKICKVLIPFKDRVTGVINEVGDEIRLTDERIEEIRTVNTNIVKVLRGAPKPKTKKKNE